MRCVHVLLITGVETTEWFTTPWCWVLWSSKVNRSRASSAADRQESEEIRVPLLLISVETVGLSKVCEYKTMTLDYFWLDLISFIKFLTFDRLMWNRYLLVTTQAKIRNCVSMEHLDFPSWIDQAQRRSLFDSSSISFQKLVQNLYTVCTSWEFDSVYWTYLYQIKLKCHFF